MDLSGSETLTDESKSPTRACSAVVKYWLTPSFANSYNTDWLKHFSTSFLSTKPIQVCCGCPGFAIANGGGKNPGNCEETRDACRVAAHVNQIYVIVAFELEMILEMI